MIKKFVLLLILYANIAYGATQASSSNPFNVDTETTVGVAAPIGAMASATIFNREDSVDAAANAAPICNPFLSAEGEVPSPGLINPFTGEPIPEDNLRDLKYPLERKILREFSDAIRTETMGTTYAQRVELVPNLLTRALSSPLHALIQKRVAVLENLGIPKEVQSLLPRVSPPPAEIVTLRFLGMDIAMPPRSTYLGIIKIEYSFQDKVLALLAGPLVRLRSTGIKAVGERAHEFFNGVMLGIYDHSEIYPSFVESRDAQRMFSSVIQASAEEGAPTTMAAHSTTAATLPEWALSYFEPVEREKTIWRAFGYNLVSFMNTVIVRLRSLLPKDTAGQVYRESPVGFYLRIGDCVKENMGAIKGLLANTGGMIADSITAGKIIATSRPLSASLPFYFTAGQAASFGISSGAVLLMPYGVPMGLDAIELAYKGDFTQAGVKAASSLALLTSPWSIKVALDLRQWPSLFSDQCFPLPWAPYFDQRIGQTESQLIASILANPMPVLTTSVSAVGVAYGTYQNVLTLTKKNTNWSMGWKKRLAAVLSLVGNAVYLNTSAVNLGMYTPEDGTLLASASTHGNTIFLATTALSTTLRLWDSMTTYHQVKANINAHLSGAPKPGTMAHAYDTNMTLLSKAFETGARSAAGAVEAGGRMVGGVVNRVTGWFSSSAEASSQLRQR